MKTIASFVFFLLVACLFSASKHQKPYPVYEWKLPPSIVNCIEPIDMNPAIFEKATSFWEDQGHTFLFKENYTGDICDSPLPHGFIVIKISYDLTFYVLGKTERVFRGETNEMEASIIYLNYNHAEDDIVLIHEIGHALGYVHVDEIGHIMNPLRPNADYHFY